MFIPAFSTVSAAFQSQGKGRDNRIWQSEQGKNALFSFVVYPGWDAGKTYILYQIAAIAVAESITEHTDTDAVIKYPNDILINGKKVAGILIDTAIRERKLRYAVVGIGLNVNQKEFPSGLNATSLYKETGKSFNPDDFIIDIIQRFKNVYDNWSGNEIFSRYLYLWDKKGIKKGVVAGGNEIKGRISEIKDDFIKIKTPLGVYDFPVREVKALL
jgi:BirA family biotin operon repressor/biotin-[acetyl-CoA-carboxylase] ligase